MRIRPIVSASFVLLVASCGPTQPEPRTAAPEPTASATVPPSQLGQYASADGIVLVVMDRTGTSPKVRIGREGAVVELFVEEARGGNAGHWMNGPDGMHWFFLGEDGRLLYVRPEARKNVTTASIDVMGVSLQREAGATPLGPATQTGIATPLPAKTPFEAAREKLESMSIIARYPRFKPEDSGSLAKVEEAFQNVDVGLFCRLSVQGAPLARWAPASEFIGTTRQGLGGVIGGFHSQQPWVASSKGLAGFGGALEARVAYREPSRLRVHQLKGWPHPALPGTPGLVWMVSGTTVVLVTVDGGRYEITLSREAGARLPVETGAGEPSKWPPPLQHSLIDVDSIRGLAKGEAITVKQGSDIEQLDDAWWSCVNDVWDAGQKEMTKIEASPESANSKLGRMSAVPARYEARARIQCEPTRQRLEAGIVQFIDARNKARLALYAKVKARLPQSP